MNLRKTAKDQDCTLRIPGVCNFDPETTVLAHINCLDKGVGYKSPDFWGVFACSSCHAALDGHKIPLESRSSYILSALYETWRHWVRSGAVKLS